MLIKILVGVMSYTEYPHHRYVPGLTAAKYFLHQLSLFCLIDKAKATLLNDLALLFCMVKSL